MILQLIIQRLLYWSIFNLAEETIVMLLVTGPSKKWIVHTFHFSH